MLGEKAWISAYSQIQNALGRSLVMIHVGALCHFELLMFAVIINLKLQIKVRIIYKMFLQLILSMRCDDLFFLKIL